MKELIIYETKKKIIIIQPFKENVSKLIIMKIVVRVKAELPGKLRSLHYPAAGFVQALLNFTERYHSLEVKHQSRPKQHPISPVLTKKKKMITETITS